MAVSRKKTAMKTKASATKASTAKTAMPGGGMGLGRGLAIGAGGLGTLFALKQLFAGSSHDTVPAGFSQSPWATAVGGLVGSEDRMGIDELEARLRAMSDVAARRDAVMPGLTEDIARLIEDNRETLSMASYPMQKSLRQRYAEQGLLGG